MLYLISELKAQLSFKHFRKMKTHHLLKEKHKLLNIRDLMAPFLKLGKNSNFSQELEVKSHKKL